ncbi:hypothetical protein GLOTRDRAFT_95228 [Gloeophyllum trabeum ATCC 11539]|uniref:F-box domain-containing protein n=1 Tax=Gloeophyllum trabeum (strain ATCC 11539 / FP-39264 / Madison 617) TaxID=670483 RepID=S7RKN8_GLOTA|nr:uncharacterized protein GLOTRDRAFT_95228 [Gloeophyllum trabeum ATCC 11539]EPQ53234.1 hypothetical protein GLOTRDRAFT_95228 [Gloeophyllum trabeum ATCC 11539]
MPRGLLMNVESGKADEEAVSSGSASAPHYKRTKNRPSDGKNKGRGKSRTGKLAYLLDVPMDIFFEILSQLAPLDLLQLSRVSKAFRAELMSRSAKHIWAASRQNNFPGCPDCPADLSEPRYANLLFEHNCMECGSSPSKMIDYVLRVSVKKGATMAKTYGKAIDDVVYTLLPCATINGYYQDPDSSMSWSGSYANNGKLHYHKAEFEEVVQKYLSFGARDTESRVKYIQDRRDSTEAIMKHGFEINEWKQQARYEQAAEESLKQRRRQQSIKAKLIELGHGPRTWPTSYRYPCYGTWTKVLDQPRELTPRIWSAVLPKLLSCIEEVKEVHAEEERRRLRCIRKKEFFAIYMAFLHDLDDAKAARMPDFGRAVELEPVVSFIDEQGCTIPVTEERWSSIQDEFMTSAKKAEPEIRKQYLSQVFTSEQPGWGAAPSSLQLDEAFLSSPQALYACPVVGCHELCRFPEIQLHPHVQYAWTAREDGLLVPALAYCKEQTVDIALKVLRILGLPEDSSQSMLEGLRGRLECLCRNPGLLQPMSFGALVSYSCRDR